MCLRDIAGDAGRWVKLDDGEVSECAMHDDDEMKAQCFGGEYTGEGPEHEEMSMLAVQLAAKFLFQVGFHTKKTLRGPAADWQDILCQHLRCSQAARTWFATDLFKHSHR
ncbi:unnamed protein product [Danaus chrysippus]|uniref:(African queen) hypothetical protein n=1 Tax=Danaus chrysippus TaxID=151541 RepID=A0A8J2W0I5_9NEOP|nr:unnamed protein product [Danaus chrysippus]